jgi:hypothetical protein
MDDIGTRQRRLAIIGRGAFLGFLWGSVFGGLTYAVVQTAAGWSVP